MPRKQSMQNRRRVWIALWISLTGHAIFIGLAHPPSSTSNAKVRAQQEILVRIESTPRAIPVPELKPVLTSSTPSSPEIPNPPPTPTPPPPAPTPTPSSQNTRLVDQQEAPSISEPTPPAPAGFSLPLDATYYKFRELDAEPAGSYKPHPLYPPEANALNQGGRVLLRLYIEYDGSVSKAEVADVYPGGELGDKFSQAALNSIHDLKFSPPRRQGQAVRAKLEYWVLFRPGM